MKLEINKSYILFTNSEYILNKKIRVLSYMNYDRASEYASFTENVAINEKFIDSSGDTDYLKKDEQYKIVNADYFEYQIIQYFPH